MGREPSNTFQDLIKEYDVVLKGPFNYTARDEAGNPENGNFWLAWHKSVHDRLACIVEMEKENASLGRRSTDYLPYLNQSS
uniref:Uncharacterized protein n=1 Tax=Zea mays TaxID=4577 RepID=A0A804P0D0_MAIZE